MIKRILMIMILGIMMTGCATQQMGAVTEGTSALPTYSSKSEAAKAFLAAKEIILAGHTNCCGSEYSIVLDVEGGKFNIQINNNTCFKGVYTAKYHVDENDNFVMDSAALSGTEGVIGCMSMRYVIDPITKKAEEFNFYPLTNKWEGPFKKTFKEVRFK